jgi:homospermidine synthase
MRTKFNGKILILGCGGVSQCTLPLLLKHLDLPRDRITVLDLVDHRDEIREALASGVRYILEEITRLRYRQQLAQYVGRGDLIVDLAWNLGCTDLLDWCHEQGVLYINTSVELWDPERQAKEAPTEQRTLYARQMDIRRLISRWREKPGPTAILEHGANPGLISHFAKMALLDISDRWLHTFPHEARQRAIERALSDEQFNHLAQLLDVRVIHISELDTQVSNRPKAENEFVNTWSIEGFHEEGTAPAEIGWGTHEVELPPDAVTHHDQGPRNQICLERIGINTFVRSCVPTREIVGMVVRHGEAFSISEALTVPGETHARYRPTVHYAYHPCEAACESLAELRARNYQLQPERRILSDDIVSGFDELGCLVMGHPFKSWWTGTHLDIDEARRLVPGQNATTLQVAAAVLAAVCWIVRNPQQGVLLPDHLPHREIMEIARPYLGSIISQAIDWMPDPSFAERVADDESWIIQRFLHST